MTPLSVKLTDASGKDGIRLYRMTNLSLKLKRTATRLSGSTTFETSDDVTLTITGVNLSYSNYSVYDDNSRVFQFKATAGGSLPAVISGRTIRKTINDKGEVVSANTVSYTGFTVTSGNVIDLRFSK